MMGYALYWVELLAVTCLMVALLTACAARVSSRVLQWFLAALGALPPLLVWAITTFVVVWCHFKFHLGWVGRMYTVGALTLVFAIAVVILFAVGLVRKRPADGRPAAAGWPRAKLAGVFSVAVLLTLMTLWNLDLSVQNRLAVVRARVGAIVMTEMPRPIPDKDNAAVPYTRAIEVLRLGEKPAPVWTEKVADWLGRFGDRGATTRPTAAETAEIRKIVRDQLPGLRLLRQAGNLEGCNFDRNWDTTDLISVLLPELGHLRSAARLLAADARVQAADGNRAAAMADVHALFSMAVHVSREPTLVSALVGMAIDSIACTTLEAVLASPGLTAEELSQLKLDVGFSHTRNARRSLRMEEAFGLSILSAPGEEIVDVAEVDHMVGLAALPLYRVFLLPDDLAGYRTLMRRMQQLAAKPYHQARGEWIALRDELRAARVGPMSAMLLPALTKFMEGCADGEARRRMARLAVAAEAYRIKTGRLPKKADDLLRQSETLPVVPLDPFDGRPLRWKVAKDGSVTIYSIGRDGIDDGGTGMDPDTRKGDRVFHLRRKK